MKIQNALVSNMLDRSQRYFAHVTTVTLSWRVQNIVVIGRVYFTLECFEFSSNFEFDRNMLSGTGAWCLVMQGKGHQQSQHWQVLLWYSGFSWVHVFCMVHIFSQWCTSLQVFRLMTRVPLRWIKSWFDISVWNVCFWWPLLRLIYQYFSTCLYSFAKQCVIELPKFIQIHVEILYDWNHMYLHLHTVKPLI